MIKILVSRYDDVNKEEIDKFSTEHWGKSLDTPEYLRLNFYLPPDYYVLAYLKSKLVGLIGLGIRSDILIGSVHASCGTIGGVVVHRDHRMQGIAHAMLKEAMKKLAKENVDIAILCTDIQKLSAMYSKVGFVVLDKPYYFYNLNGETVANNEGMIAAIKSKELLDLARQKATKINIGKSNV